MQYLQQLLPTGVPCPDCGVWAVVQVLNYEVGSQVITPQGMQGVGKGVTGFSFCLACRTQHSLVPNTLTNKWEIKGEERTEEMP